MYYWKNYLPEMATNTSFCFVHSFFGVCAELYSHADYTDDYSVVFFMEGDSASHCFVPKERIIEYAKKYGGDCQIFVITPTTGELNFY